MNENNKDKRTERLFLAIGQVDEKLIRSTEPTHKKRDKYVVRLLATAAVLTLVFFGAKAVFSPAGGAGKEGAMTLSEGEKGDANGGEDLEGCQFDTFYGGNQPALVFVEASNPLQTTDDELDYSTTLNSNSAGVEREEGTAKSTLPRSFTSWLTETDRTQKLLSVAGEENRVLSPLNISMEMAMLAELSNGESRSELLAEMGFGENTKENREAFRQEVQRIWEQTYYDTVDGSACHYSNALWLRNDAKYSFKKITKVADDYNTSSYGGEIGNAMYTWYHNQWLEKATAGGIKEETKEDAFPKNMEIGVSSAIHYLGFWEKGFQMKKEQVFHGTNGDRQVSMNEGTGEYRVYRGEHYVAAEIPMKDDKNFLLFLPDEGYKLADVYAEESYTEILQGIRNGEVKRINLSFPQFDITTKLDLKETMEEFGIKGIFSNDKAFRKFVNGGDNVTNLHHALHFRIGSGGINTSSYQDSLAEEGIQKDKGAEKICFDRPFGFAVTDGTGLVYFEGTMQQ